jgi:CBS domain-containing protein
MRIDGVLRAKGNEVISVAPHAILREAAELLHKHRIGALLVLDSNQELIGIISERDIVGIVAERGSDALYARVDQAMSSEVVVCSPLDTVEQLMSVMTERRIRHLPVVEDGQLVGIVSIGDVVKRRLAEVCDEADALHGYLTSTR